MRWLFCIKRLGAYEHHLSVMSLLPPNCISSKRELDCAPAIDEIKGWTYAGHGLLPWASMCCFESYCCC